MKMSKLTITESVKIIPVSESTLRRDLKSGNVSFETDEKGRKQIDISELERFYGQMNGSENRHNLSLTENDSQKVIDFLEEQIEELKKRLAQADAEKTQLLKLANNLQKQNELLIAIKSQEKTKFIGIPPSEEVILKQDS